MTVVVGKGVEVLLIMFLGLTGLSSGIALHEYHTPDITIHYDNGTTFKGIINNLEETTVFVGEEKENGNIHFRFINKNGDMEIEYERNNNGKIPKEDKEYIDKMLKQITEERELKREKSIRDNELEKEKQLLDKYKIEKQHETEKLKLGIKEEEKNIGFWKGLLNYINGRSGS
ncbi:MAG: hypothetical protein ACOCZ5_00470 [bacterium]